MTKAQGIIVGTAGHIDHGKTSLVRALTGKDTDRLKEEKERGISIDIDFAPLKYPDGTLIGMVDVPGHERFVRNMVAGAAGIDAALLVIDINEGMKPQTQEHIAVLQLLGVKTGVVALTKVDLADPEWLEVAQEVIRESLQSTVFACAPVVLTSTKTGQGVEELKRVLKRETEDLALRDASGAFRLPIDKVFSIPGFGTVVSGTVWRGQISVGDSVDCLPARHAVRIRGIQVHGQAVQSVAAGQRAALNLTGVDKNELSRGSVLAAEGTLHETKLLDVQVSVLSQHDKALRHRDRVHVHTGTAETIGRILLLECDTLVPGDSGFAQVLLERPLVCEGTDAFILRTYSPVTTLGGGVIIDATPSRVHRRKRAHVIEQLTLRHSESPLQRLLAIANQGRAVSVDQAVSELGVTHAEANSLLASGAELGELQLLPSGWYAIRSIEETLRILQTALVETHQKQRFTAWVPRAVVAHAVATVPPRDLDWFFAEGARRGAWRLQGAVVQRIGHQVQLTPEEQSMYDLMLTQLRAAELNGIGQAGLVGRFAKRDRVASALLSYGQECGEMIEIDHGMWLAADVFQRALDEVCALYQAVGPITVAGVRDVLRTSRKNALTLLEYLDRVGMTRRQEDVRILMNVTNT